MMSRDDHRFGERGLGPGVPERRDAWLDADQVDSARAMVVQDAIARYPADPLCCRAPSHGHLFRGKASRRERTGAADWPRCTIPADARSFRHTFASRAPALEGASENRRSWAGRRWLRERTRRATADYYRDSGDPERSGAMRTGDPLNRPDIPRLGDTPRALRVGASGRTTLPELAVRYARLGDAARARCLLSEEASALDYHQMRGSRSVRAAALGEIALLEGKPTEAIARFREGWRSTRPAFPALPPALSAPSMRQETPTQPSPGASATWRAPATGVFRPTGGRCRHC